jgi:hypothetical protein
MDQVDMRAVGRPRTANLPCRPVSAIPLLPVDWSMAMAATPCAGRPVTAEEVAHYVKLYDMARKLAA